MITKYPGYQDLIATQQAVQYSYLAVTAVGGVGIASMFMLRNAPKRWKQLMYTAFVIGFYLLVICLLAISTALS